MIELGGSLNTSGIKLAAATGIMCCGIASNIRLGTNILDMAAANEAMEGAWLEEREERLRCDSHGDIGVESTFLRLTTSS